MLGRGSYTRPRYARTVQPTHGFTDEGNPREPIHVPALRGDAATKFRLKLTVQVADNVGFNARILSELVAVV